MRLTESRLSRLPTRARRCPLAITSLSLSRSNRLVDLAEKTGQYEKYPLTKYDPEQAKQILE